MDGEGEDFAGHVTKVDVVGVGRGGAKEVAGAEGVLVVELAGGGVDGVQGAIDVADEDVVAAAQKELS